MRPDPHVCVLTVVKQRFTRTTITQTAPLVTFPPVGAIARPHHPTLSGQRADPFTFRRLFLPQHDSNLTLYCAQVLSIRRGTFSHNGYVATRRHKPFLARPTVEAEPPQTGNDRRPSLTVFCSSVALKWNTSRHVAHRIPSVPGSTDLDPCSNSKACPDVPVLDHFTKCDQMDRCLPECNVIMTERNSQ